jgi:hypothetical protein|tara:strand:- start:5693 stop:5854 length:162 start_codon:yes stop_codon:yes gene_type:complete
MNCTLAKRARIAESIFFCMVNNFANPMHLVFGVPQIRTNGFIAPMAIEDRLHV